MGGLGRARFAIILALGLAACSESPHADIPGTAGAGALVPAQAADSAVAEVVCGDGACGFGESCRTCQRDCGACTRPFEMFFTQPIADAEVALADETTGALEAALLADLDAAKLTIWLAIYDLSRQSVIRALYRALERGVDVRVVTECEHRIGSRGALLTELEAAGARVQDDQSSFGGLEPGCPMDGASMHHKFVLIDGQLVWAGSANLTPTDLNYNHNAAFRFDSVEVELVFQEEWDELWSGHFGIEKAARPKRTLEVGGALLEIGFSPRRSSPGESVTRTLVLDALEQAESSIGLALFALTDTPVFEFLEGRFHLVRGVLDASLAGQQSSLSRPLCEGGAFVVVENFPGKVHHKLGVIDGGRPGGLLLGGSANWSSSGFDHNDEALIVIRNADLARRAAEHLASLIDDPAHDGGSCCFHGAEAYDEASPVCGEAPCVCKNGLDDDFDGQEDGADAGCDAPFSCAP